MNPSFHPLYWKNIVSPYNCTWKSLSLKKGDITKIAIYRDKSKIKIVPNIFSSTGKVKKRICTIDINGRKCSKYLVHLLWHFLQYIYDCKSCATLLVLVEKRGISTSMCIGTNKAHSPEKQ